MTEPFIKAFSKLPQDKQKLFGKQFGLLLNDFRHPSLNTKIYDASRRMWQARVDQGYRFYFEIEGNLIILHGIGPHPWGIEQRTSAATCLFRGGGDEMLIS